jgi:hypothetical protein
MLNKFSITSHHQEQIEEADENQSLTNYSTCQK